MMNRGIAIFCSLVFSSSISTAAAAAAVAVAHKDVQVHLLKDIWPGPKNGLFLLQRTMNVNDIAVHFFVADDGQHGRELWSTDGTPENTVMVKDIIEGDQGSEPLNFDILNNEGPLIFVHRSDGSAGYSMYTLAEEDKTDLLRSFWTIMASRTRGSDPKDYALVKKNGLVVYRARSSSSERVTLWSTNLYESGTKQILFRIPENPFVAWSGGTIVFAVRPDDDAGLGPSIWETDGTEAGTRLVLDSFGNSSNVEDIYGLCSPVEGTLMFVVEDSSTGTSIPGIWVSDLTPEGTYLFQGQTAFVQSTVFVATPFENNLEFVAAVGSDDDEEDGKKVVFSNIYTAQIFDRYVTAAELWTTDLSSSSSSRSQAKRIFRIEDDTGKLVFRTFRSNGYGKAYALLYNQTESAYTAVYATDGTVNGTFLVLDASPSPDSTYRYDGVRSTTVLSDGRLLVGVYAKENPYDLYVMDAESPENAQLIQAFNWSIYDFGLFDARRPTVLNNSAVLFEGIDEEHGEELWILTYEPQRSPLWTAGQGSDETQTETQNDDDDDEEMVEESSNCHCRLSSYWTVALIFLI